MASPVEYSVNCVLHPISCWGNNNNFQEKEWFQPQHYLVHDVRDQLFCLICAGKQLIEFSSDQQQQNISSRRFIVQNLFKLAQIQFPIPSEISILIVRGVLKSLEYNQESNIHACDDKMKYYMLQICTAPMYRESCYKLIIQILTQFRETKQQYELKDCDPFFSFLTELCSDEKFVTGLSASSSCFFDLVYDEALPNNLLWMKIAMVYPMETYRHYGLNLITQLLEVGSQAANNGQEEIMLSATQVLLSLIKQEAQLPMFQFLGGEQMTNRMRSFFTFLYQAIHFFSTSSKIQNAIQQLIHLQIQSFPSIEYRKYYISNLIQMDIIESMFLQLQSSVSVINQKQLLEVLYQLSEVSNDILGSAFFHFSALLNILINSGTLHENRMICLSFLRRLCQYCSDMTINQQYSTFEISSNERMALVMALILLQDDENCLALVLSCWKSVLTWQRQTIHASTTTFLVEPVILDSIQRCVVYAQEQLARDDFSSSQEVVDGILLILVEIIVTCPAQEKKEGDSNLIRKWCYGQFEQMLDTEEYWVNFKWSESRACLKFILLLLTHTQMYHSGIQLLLKRNGLALFLITSSIQESKQRQHAQDTDDMHELVVMILYELHSKLPQVYPHLAHVYAVKKIAPLSFFSRMLLLPRDHENQQPMLFYEIQIELYCFAIYFLNEDRIQAQVISENVNYYLEQLMDAHILDHFAYQSVTWMNTMFLYGYAMSRSHYQHRASIRMNVLKAFYHSSSEPLSWRRDELSQPRENSGKWPRWSLMTLLWIGAIISNPDGLDPQHEEETNRRMILPIQNCLLRMRQDSSTDDHRHQQLSAFPRVFVECPHGMPLLTTTLVRSNHVEEQQQIVQYVHDILHQSGSRHWSTELRNGTTKHLIRYFIHDASKSSNGNNDRMDHLRKDVVHLILKSSGDLSIESRDDSTAQDSIEQMIPTLCHSSILNLRQPGSQKDKFDRTNVYLQLLMKLLMSTHLRSHVIQQHVPSDFCPALLAAIVEQHDIIHVVDSFKIFLLLNEFQYILEYRMRVSTTLWTNDSQHYLYYYGCVVNHRSMAKGDDPSGSLLVHQSFFCTCECEHVRLMLVKHFVVLEGPSGFQFQHNLWWRRIVLALHKKIMCPAQDYQNSHLFLLTLIYRMNPHDVAAEMVDVHLPMNQLLHDFKTTPRAPFRSHGQLLLLWTYFSTIDSSIGPRLRQCLRSYQLCPLTSHSIRSPIDLLEREFPLPWHELEESMILRTNHHPVRESLVHFHSTTDQVVEAIRVQLTLSHLS